MFFIEEIVKFQSIFLEYFMKNGLLRAKKLAPRPVNGRASAAFAACRFHNVTRVDIDCIWFKSRPLPD